MSVDDFEPTIDAYGESTIGPEILVNIGARDPGATQSGADIVTLVNAELGTTDWQGNAAASSVTYTLNAAETISAMQVVTETTLGAELYEPDPLGQDLFGVAITAATAGNPIEVVTDGPVDPAGPGLTPGATYYAGPGGTLVVTPPTSGLLVPIGFAATSTRFIVQVGEPIELA